MNETKTYTSELKSGSITFTGEGDTPFEALKALDPHKDGLFMFKPKGILTIKKGEKGHTRLLTPFQCKRIFNKLGFKVAAELQANYFNQALNG